MFYLIIHMQREEYEDDLLLAMASAGVMDAVVVDAISARERMAHALPIFAGFSADLTGKGSYAKIIAAIVRDQTAVDDLLSELKEADIDFVEDEIGTMTLLPAARVVAPTAADDTASS